MIFLCVRAASSTMTLTTVVSVHFSVMLHLRLRLSEPGVSAVRHSVPLFQCLHARHSLAQVHQRFSNDRDKRELFG